MSGFRPQYMQKADSDGYSPIAPAVLFDGNESALSATFNTCPFFVGDNGDSVAVSFSCPSTGSPVFTLTVEASLDIGSDGPRNDGSPSVATWHALTFLDVASGSMVSSMSVSGATTILIDLGSCNYNWIRLALARTSGSVTPKIVVKFRRMS